MYIFTTFLLQQACNFMEYYRVYI